MEGDSEVLKMTLLKIQEGVTRGYYFPSFRDEMSVSWLGFWVRIIPATP